MNYKFISNLEDTDYHLWDELVESSQYRSPFQTPKTYDFWKMQDKCIPLVYGLKNQDDELMAVCLIVVQYNFNGAKKYFSKRAIIYGGVVLADNCDKKKVLDSLLKGINKDLKSKTIYAEFRNAFSYQDYGSVFMENGYHYIPYQNFKIDLTDEDTLFANFTSEKRRQIRRSFREGVEISYENSDFNIQGVYNIIHKIYTEKVKKPLPDLSFFKDLATADFGNVTALIYQGEVIGGGFLVYDENTVYDWYRGGLDREYKHQYPSTVAAWATIEFGLRKNLKTFDFMGAGIKGEDYGVRKFKAQFGGELVEHGRYQLILNPIKYKLAKFGFNLINKIR